MNKVILVMDDPVRCLNCPLSWYKYMGGWLCSMEQGEEDGVPIYKSIDIGSKVRPDWCPLRVAPEKDEVHYLREWSVGYKKGWNACVNYLVDEQNGS